MAPGAGAAPEFVDAALFMGMHSADDRVRLACKGFFIDRLATGVSISLEQVGRCDDIVWSHPREVQDAYYPFMDNLHTDMAVARVGYDLADITAALESLVLPDLPITERLTLGQVVARGAILYTVDSRFPVSSGLPVLVPSPVDTEPEFPDKLEQLYQESLVLRVDPSGGGWR
ncbi:DUF6190 family protein [Actinokineospora globicatena]|uniref:Uncharacterized protein n=1 Tax=Actinokineospora globicatena TaxID=103729 RepID=A0A9W6QKB5_9PSEU|nr:DUF6190 family protein [Actinokineospora globicatena]GLW91245.1 hypothetical protein Aglo03_20610 [Actinokineospora globicatena]